MIFLTTNHLLGGIFLTTKYDILSACNFSSMPLASYSWKYIGTTANNIKARFKKYIGTVENTLISLDPYIPNIPFDK